MKITKLTLIGNKRLLLNNVHKITIDVTNPFQIFIGRNGSGKSTLLRELTPLPAIASDYTKGGSKTIELEHGNSKYILVSNFKAANKHSFSKDGEELNPGGTLTVQKDLVKEHFRLTAEIHKLLTGQIRFTEMSPAKRREWITAMSDTDLTYAISTYNKLRSKHRDSQGAFKHVSGRLITESSALEYYKDANGLSEEVRQLENEIMVLMENRQSGLPAYQQVRGVLETNLNRLQELSERVLNMDLINRTGFELNSEEELTELLSKKQTQLQVTHSRLNHLTSDYTELENVLQQSQSVEGSDSPEELKAKESDLTIQIESLKTKVRRFYIENPSEKAVDTGECIASLKDILSTIEDNSDRRYNRDTFKEKSDLIEEINKRLDQVGHHKSQVQRKIHHIQQAKETKCPQCGYVWKDGVSEKDLEWLEDEIIATNKREEDLRQSRESTDQYLESARAWQADLNNFKTLVNSYPRLKQLWDALIEDGCPNTNPQSHLPTISTWMFDLETCREIERLQKHLEQTQTSLASLGDQASTQHLKDRFARLGSDIDQTHQQLNVLQEEVKRLKRYRDIVMEATRYEQDIMHLSEEVLRGRDTLVDIIRNESVVNCIGDHQGTLGQLKQKLNEKSALEALVDDLKASSNTLADDVEALKLIVAELSPQEGLIAEQLTGFIGSLTDQMSEVISQIWTYEMPVLPCGIESNDLDYKFPLQVSSPDNICPDISEASEGQKEIINFAFMVVFTLYMDFMNYPLYLDELGRTFDEQHRTNTVDYVKVLMDSRRYTQVFYISHFACSYGAMSSADITVLDSSNVAVPVKINQNAQIG